MPTNLIIGLGAGLVSAMLFASAATGTFLGVFVLFFLSPLPIAIAGLGWGWPAAAIASTVGALLIGALTPVRGAIIHGLALGLPTTVLCYLALLHRQTRNDLGAAATEWYPLGRILVAAALMAGTLATVALYATASDIDGLRDHIGKALESLTKRPAGAALPPGLPDAASPEQLGRLTGLLASMFTASLASTWFAIAVFNLWLAGRVVRTSQRLLRPWPDLNALQLSRLAPLLLVVALGSTFLSGYPGLIAAGFASALLMAYTLVGLAIIHSYTRGKDQRPVLLAALYTALVVFGPLLSPLLVLLALAEPYLPLRRDASHGSQST